MKTAFAAILVLLVLGCADRERLPRSLGAAQIVVGHVVAVREWTVVAGASSIDATFGEATEFDFETSDPPGMRIRFVSQSDCLSPVAGAQRYLVFLDAKHLVYGLKHDEETRDLPGLVVSACTPIDAASAAGFRLGTRPYFPIGAARRSEGMR